MSKIYLSLGSNIGDTRANLNEAVELLREKIDIKKLSSFYETEPVGFAEQDWFLNIALEAETDLSPQELIAFTQSIEQGMGRVKEFVNGPRNIDIDILLYEGYSSDDATLTVPHPRMTERNFVVQPLYEIAPELVIDGRSLKEIREGLNGEEIRKLDD